MFQYSFKKTQAESNHWKLEYKLIFPLCLPLVAELILDEMFFSYGRLNRKLLFLSLKQRALHLGLCQTAVLTLTQVGALRLLAGGAPLTPLAAFL